MQKIHISMQEDTLLVCRNAFYLDSLNINYLPRHLISMAEIKLVCRKVCCDVMD